MGLSNQSVPKGHQTPLKSEEAIRSAVKNLVEEVHVVDVHTHLFPPNHGKLMLWGIDELLTYHYLVAEYFITAPATITPEKFFALEKQAQADLVWDSLFIQRSPISEACRGVITTLTELGLGELVERRDLDGVRKWFAKQTPEGYVDKVFELAKIKYVLTTNIPFEKKETVHWYPKTKEFDTNRFHTGLRVDQLLTGNWESIKEALDEMGIEHTIEGVKKLLEKWITIIKPKYFMAAVPPTLEFPSDEEMSTYAPSTINSATLLRRVLLPLAEQHHLPIAFKFDSVRPINPALREGGDGVVTTKVSTLQKLCLNYPKVKFLATFLARVNQHELCVLANKFGNLHIYGCWWYCNNPSIVEEITRIRVELLGTAFTSQHSDARVLDQLIYKWKHSKAVIGGVLQDMYVKLFHAGWSLTREEIQRDVERLFGGAYEEFMEK
uniref:Glucuronate isomerase n=1 Tax=Acrobeloides nanus TaxID=290746 RepID=A0A914DQ73_9BILA